ncbi:MAG: PQQ-binding-like beta-propeller repeat protein, partial [Patescibacteria group bacterium]|nr:PQQ-binding-like beta-propeller repeat protein [Patescibacteria group bacterium]
SDGTIYVGSGYRIYALNPNGELIWESPQLSNGKWVKSPVLDSEGNIYAVIQIGSWVSKKYIYALNSQDGSIIWKSLPEKFFTAPSLTSDGLILVGGYMGGYNYNGLHAIDSLDGSHEWYAPIGNIVGSIAAIGQDAIYVGTDSYAFRAINKEDGSIKWSFYAQGKFSASPIIDAEGTIYIGSQRGMFYALNPDGSVKWQAELDSAINSSAVIGADGIIYVASSDGILYAFGE